MREVTQEQLQQEFEQGFIVLKWFGAGCGNCKMQEAIIDQIEPTRPDVKFLKIDVSNAMELAREYGVTTLPRTSFVKDATIVEAFDGLKPKPIILKKIEEIFG